jgi:glutamyl-tRNA synthetase
VQGKPHDCDKLKKEVSDDRASKGESYVVRLNINGQNPDYVDLVYGRVKGHKGRDPRLTGRAIDPVLMKSDRWPTYHLANVVDDHLMKITHVIRGTEWMPSTPTHLQLYSAFGWQPPVFGHVGLLTDMTGAKLSKRNFDLDIRSYQKNGVLPEALNNFIALLGWSHLKQKDTMSLAELTANFTTKFTKGNTKVSFDKLWFLQRQHARKLIEAAESPEQAKQLIQPVIEQLISQKSNFISAVPDQQVQQERSLALLKNAEDFVQRHRLFFDRPCTESLKNVSPSPFHNGHLEPPFEAIDGDQHIRASNLSQILIENFKQVADGDWTKDKLFQRFKQVVNSIALESGEGTAVTEGTQQLLVKRWNWAGHRYLRWALFADQAGPDTISMMAALGKDEALKRLETAASALQEMHVRQ